MDDPEMLEAGQEWGELITAGAEGRKRNNGRIYDYREHPLLMKSKASPTLTAQPGPQPELGP